MYCNYSFFENLVQISKVATEQKGKLKIKKNEFISWFFLMLFNVTAKRLFLENVLY